MSDMHVVNQVVDTVDVIEGKLVPSEGTLGEPSSFNLMSIVEEGEIPEYQSFEFILGNGTTRLDMNLQGVNIGFHMQSGTPLNEALSHFQEQFYPLYLGKTSSSDSLYLQRLDSLMRSELTRHNDDVVGITALRHVVGNTPPQAVVPWMEMMSPRIKAGAVWRMMGTVISSHDVELKSQGLYFYPPVGAKYEDFTVEYDGRSTKLSDYVGHGQYVLIDSTAYNAVPMLLMVSTKETQRLDMDYSEVFQPYISHRIDELILSKNYSSWPVCDSIGREKKIHEILMPNYCDLSSEESLLMQDYFTKFSMTRDDGWQPDPSQRIYLFHSRSDDYVPIQSARPMVKFLKKKGLKPSIIPGKTNFQTNFLVTGMGHLSATLIYYVQTLAAIKAWPMMYKDNKLNPLYQAIVSKEVDIVGTMRQLDAMGFDCKTFINYAMDAIFSSSGSEEESSIDLIEIMMAINTALGKMNLEMEDVLEMSEDSGIDLMGFLFDLIIYLNEDSDSDEAAADNGVEVRENREAKVAQRIQALKASSKTPRDYYEEELTEWLKANGIESLE